MNSRWESKYWYKGHSLVNLRIHILNWSIAVLEMSILKDISLFISTCILNLVSLLGLGPSIGKGPGVNF